MARSHGSQMSSPRPVLLLLEGHVARRLALVVALRDSFDVRTAEEDGELMRMSRSLRPELVIIGVDPLRAARSLRTSRLLRSEPSAPRVGLLHPGARRPKPDEVMRESLANGYLGGDAEPQRVRAWALRILSGEEAIEISPASGRSWLRRVLGG